MEYEVNISGSCCLFDIDIMQIILPEAEFKEFQPRRWIAQNRFQLSEYPNLETLNTIASGTNQII